MPRHSWCARVLLCLPAPLAACGGDLGPRIPASIIIVPNEPKVPLGGTRQLTATVVDAAGRATDGEPLTFESDNTDVITVSATGLLEAVGPLGFARISVTSGELTAGVVAQTVLPPSALLVQPKELALQASEVAQLFVTVTDEDGQPINATITYSSSNGNVVTVDGFGFVTAQATGTATITVSAPDRTPVEVPVTVDQVPTTIQVTPTSVVLQAGGVQPLTVRVRDAFGALIPNAAIGFSSGDAAVASVSIGGLVRGEADGSTIIKVTSGALSTTVGTFVGDVPPGVILEHVELEGSTWGVRTKGDRYLVTSPSAFLHAGQGTGFGFSESIPVAGLTLDVDLLGSANWAYVVSAQNPGFAEAVAVVDLDAGQVIDFVEAGGQNLYAVAISPDEEYLFVGTGSGAERISLTTGEITVLGGVSGSITTWSRHPTLPRLYGNMNYTAVVEIDSENGSVLRTFNLPGGTPFAFVQSTAVSPDGTMLYAALEDSDLISWNLETGASGPRLASGGGFGLAVSPDGKVLYVARGAEVLLVDRASLTRLKAVQVGGSTRRIGVRADGVAVAANEGGWVDFIK